MDNPLKYFAELRDPRVERKPGTFTGRDPADCDCGGVERGRELERHCRLWRGQAGVAEDVLDSALRHPVARYVSTGLFAALDPLEMGKGLRRLGFVDLPG